MNPIGHIEASHKANLRNTLLLICSEELSLINMLVSKGAHFLEDIYVVSVILSYVQNHITVSV